MNRQCIYLFIFLFKAQDLVAQVDFKNINLEEAKKIAQVSNKKILIYLYSISCPACTLLVKHIFEDAEMGEYINSNYVSFKLCGDKAHKKRRLPLINY